MRNQLINQMGNVLYSYLGGWWQRIGLIACVLAWCLVGFFSDGQSDASATQPRVIDHRVSVYMHSSAGHELYPFTKDQLSKIPKDASLVTLVGEEYTDDDLAHLSKLKSLNTLQLLRTSVTGEGFKQLTGKNLLYKLELNENPISDSGLEQIAKMKKVVILELRQTDITDASMPFLKGLSNLRQIDLEQTAVTHNGLNQLLDNGSDKLRVYYDQSKLGFKELQSLEKNDNHRKIIFKQPRRKAGNFFRPYFSMFALMFCGIVIGSRVKQQFSNSRSQLLPGFCRPHLLVAIGLIAVVGLINTVLGIANEGQSGAVVGAVSAALLFAVWLGAYPHSKVSFMPAVFIFGSMAFAERLMPYLIDYWAGNYQALAMTLTAGSMVGLCLTLRKIVVANEENDDYAMPSWGDLLQVAWSKNSRPELQQMIGRQVNRSWFATWMVDVAFRYAKLNYHNGNTWKRAKLYNVMSWQRLVFLLLLFPLIVLTQLPFHSRLSAGGLSGVPFGLLCVGPAFFVCCIEGMQLFQRRSYLRYEFLRPVNRLDLTNDITFSTVLNTSLGLTCNAFWALVFIGWIDPSKLTLFFLASYFVFTILMVLVTLGLALWMGKIRKIWQYILGILVIEAIFGGAGWFFVYSQENQSMSVLICGFTLMSLVGSALVVTARQKWQEMEWA